MEQTRQVCSEGAAAYLEGKSVSNPALAMSFGAGEVAVAGCVIFGPQKFAVGDIVLLQGVAQAGACLLRSCVRADSGFWVLGEILVKMSEGLGCSRWRLQVEVGPPFHHIFLYCS